jgi:hypothetical protein
MARFITKRQNVRPLQKRNFQIPRVKDEEVAVAEETKEETNEGEVMDTKEKILAASEILSEPTNKVKKLKKEKGLIEKMESAKTILTEDNKELLAD